MIRIVASALALAATLSSAPAEEPKPFLSTAEILAASTPEEWRPIAPERLLIMTLDNGRDVFIELAPSFAPKTTANIGVLVRQNYFDGLAILRVQDNYVTQWGDPDDETPQRRPLGAALGAIAPEFARPRAGLQITSLPDGDVYAPDVGFAEGFPVAADAESAWLTHCYGMVGVARGNEADSGNGSQLYVVIGHAPRHLDRNITLVGRVVKGVDALSSLPRGTGQLGFYEPSEQRPAIRSVRFADAVGAHLEALREDSPTFAALVEARRNRRDPWSKVPAGRIELCNVSLPVRDTPLTRATARSARP